MKVAFRAVVFAAVMAVVGCASFSSQGALGIARHLAATSALPGPGCGPSTGCAANVK